MHRRHGERQVLAAPLGRHVRVQLRESLDVQLVDEACRARAPPAGGRRSSRTAVDDAAARHHGRAVDEVGLQPLGIRGVEAEESRIQLRLAHDVARPGVDQQFVGVEAVALARIVGAMHADAVQRADARQLLLDEAVMHGPVRPGSVSRAVSRVPRGVVQAHVDARRGARADREIDALAGPRRAEDVRRACASSHAPQEHRRQRRQADAQRIRIAVHGVRKGLVARDAAQSRRRRNAGKSESNSTS